VECEETRHEDECGRARSALAQPKTHDAAATRRARARTLGGRRRHLADRAVSGACAETSARG